MADYVLKSTASPEALHPFYPLEADIVGYLANQWSVTTLLGIFVGGLLVLLGTTFALVRSHNPELPTRDKATVLWFVLTGSIHLFFEGYFAFNHANMPGKQDLFGQLWKEYSFSDSRYLTSESFVLCMETVTAVCWGPMSFAVALLITSEHPLRHPLQALVSAGQVYGDVLYYATSMFDHYHKGLTHCRPEAYYFWVYYVFMNFIWIVIPGILLYSSISESSKAFKALDQQIRRTQSNGHLKKSN